MSDLCTIVCFACKIIYTIERYIKGAFIALLLFAFGALILGISEPEHYELQEKREETKYTYKQKHKGN